LSYKVGEVRGGGGGGGGGGKFASCCERDKSFLFHRMLGISWVAEVHFSSQDPSSWSHLIFKYYLRCTGLFKMIVRVLTNCRTQYTWDRSMCILLFNRTKLQVFVTYLTGALYVHHSWFYRHQHDNRVRSKLCSMSALMVSMAVLILTFSSGILAGRGGT
jgi:hypothetical protein